MRAVLVREFGPIETAALAEVPEPITAPGEVLIAIHAVPVNYADLLVIAGLYQTRPKLPFIPGKGAAGVVTALGEGVTRLRAGDRVFAWVEEGSYAEAVTAHEAVCYRLPAKMPFTDAAALGLDYATAWFALIERVRFRPGKTVLVLGASGAVGFVAVQLAKAFGARVLAGIATPDKVDLVQHAGADAIVELWWPDLRETLRAQVREATGGAGADIILDPARYSRPRCGCSPGAAEWSSLALPAAAFRRSGRTTCWLRISRSAACKSATIRQKRPRWLCAALRSCSISTITAG
jgi:NADPH:quinone reductase